MIISHLDNDHSGGAASVLRAIEVGRVISSISPGHPAFGARTDIEQCAAGMQWTSGSLAFTVVHPTPADYEAKRTTNSMSCVVVITNGATRLLLTGDVPRADEVGDPRAQSDAARRLACGTASRQPSSSGALLLDTLGARSAVAQAGYRNRFGHPDPEVIARYQREPCPLLSHRSRGRSAMALRGDGTSTVHSRPAKSMRATGITGRAVGAIAGARAAGTSRTRYDGAGRNSGTAGALRSQLNCLIRLLQSCLPAPILRLRCSTYWCACARLSTLARRAWRSTGFRSAVLGQGDAQGVRRNVRRARACPRTLSRVRTLACRSRPPTQCSSSARRPIWSFGASA